MANGLFAGGTGLINDPYLIEDADDLNAIRNDSSGKYYKLIDDIDLNVSPYNEGWEPISSFNGSLDGNGYNISGLFINDPEGDNKAFISNINGETVIKNIGFKDVNILGKDNIAVIVANINHNNFKLKDVYTTGKVEATEGIAGSFIARQINRSNLLIEHSYSTCHLETRNNYSGGFIGSATGGSNNVIRYSYFNGTQYALDYTNVRAIVGGNTNSINITNTYYNLDKVLDVPKIVGNGTPLTNIEFKNKENFVGWLDLGSLEGVKTWHFTESDGPVLWHQSLGYFLLKSVDGYYSIKDGELIFLSSDLPSYETIKKNGFRFLKDIHVDHIQELKNKSSMLDVINIVNKNAQINSRELSLVINLPREELSVEITSDIEELEDNIDTLEAGKYKHLILDIDNLVEVEEVNNQITFEKDNLAEVNNIEIQVTNDTTYLNEDRKVDIFVSKFEEIPKLENEIDDQYAVVFYDTSKESDDIDAEVVYEKEKENPLKSLKTVAFIDNSIEHNEIKNTIEYREYNDVSSLSEFILTFEAEAVSKYMISRDNGVTWWTIQGNAWINAKLDDINTVGMSIEDINKESIWRSLPTESTDKIKIAVGIKNDILSYTHSVEKFIIEFAPNSPPTVNDLTIIENPDNITVEALLKDFENDNIEYRVLIKKAYEDEFFQVTPKGGSWYKRQNNHKLSHKYPYSNLKTGINEVKVEVRDSRGDQTEESAFIVYQSGKPEYTVNYMNEFSIDATLNHTKGKEVAFRILINGVQVSPKGDGFSEFYPVPHHLHYVWDSDDLFIGITNNVVIEVTDVHDNIERIENIFIGVYKGLLFKNELGAYYSTDKNEVLHRLDFGTIVGGLDSYPSKIILENKTGFPVHNIKIWVDPEIIEEKIAIKLSKTKDEENFDSLEELQIPDVLYHNDTFEFYARIETEVDSISIKDKVFKIYANGEPYIVE